MALAVVREQHDAVRARGVPGGPGDQRDGPVEAAQHLERVAVCGPGVVCHFVVADEVCVDGGAAGDHVADDGRDHHIALHDGGEGPDDGVEEVGPCEVALLPVGGWGPFLGHGHLDARRAAQAVARLAPCSAVPVHYGTYWPIGMDAVRPHEFHAPGQEFERQVALMAPEVTVHRLGHGESVRPKVV
ncbi:MBL fold metallo-hydrolase [Streptomyces decoyicus]|uniref:MBL fold metallo-hydrolase n=1 Tax=Streptomyces decoyicus TaxID=249567 RepID=UPI0036363CB3